MGNVQRHLFHIVDASPWPLFTSIGLLGMATGGVLYFHFFLKGSVVFFLGFFTVLLTSLLWWRDVVRESTFEGNHTTSVQAGLRLGMLLFIISEVMFFASFFWTFFHSSLAPAIEIGGIWPPAPLFVFDPWAVPFLNTVILLISGATLTWAHQAIVIDFSDQAFFAFLITILLALLFTIFQLCEYVEALFTISEGIYGSIFYMSTGFHGFHVIIGSIFIIVCFFRFINMHFSSKHHLGFEAAAWYWHFVDVVWLFLFIAIYWWGNMGELSYEQCFI